MKRKIGLGISLFLLVMTLCGCIDTTMTLEIEKNGSATFSTEVLISELLAGFIAEEEFDGVLQRFDFDKIEKITESGKTGYRATWQTDDLNTFATDHLADLDRFLKENTEDLSLEEVVQIKTDKKFFYTIYDLTIPLKDRLLPYINSLNEDRWMWNFLTSQAHLKFNLKLPCKLTASNATTFSENDGSYCYIWDYTLSKTDNIALKLKVYESYKIVACVVFGLLFAGLGIYLAIRQLKQSKK
jgi:hypothetical protein